MEGLIVIMLVVILVLPAVALIAGGLALTVSAVETFKSIGGKK